MTEGFERLCESLWKDWLAGTLQSSPFVSKTFDLSAAPEPYIVFEPGKNPLVLLTTNPGGVMSFQQRASLGGGRDSLDPERDYSTAARFLGPFYRDKLKGKAAGRRISALLALSKAVRSGGVIQAELCPFHSRSLDNKDHLLREIRDNDFLQDYIKELKAFLSPKPVIALSAASTSRPMHRDMTLSQWARKLAEVAGLELDQARFVALVSKSEKVTASAFVSNLKGTTKALVLMMGSNNLPGENGRRTLALEFHR